MANKYGEFVGVGNVNVALVTNDDATTYEVGEQELLAPMGAVTIAPRVNTSNRYYGDVAYFTESSEADTTITFVLPGVEMQMAAKLLGKHYDAESKQLIDSGKAAAPYCAVNFGVHAAEGAFVGYQYLKGKFAPWQEEAESIDDSGIKAKTVSLVYTAINTSFAGWDIGGEASSAKMVKADSREDDTLTENGWYAEVQLPSRLSD